MLVKGEAAAQERAARGKAILLIAAGAACISVAAPLVRWTAAPSSVVGFYRCLVASLVLGVLHAVVERPSRAGASLPPLTLPRVRLALVAGTFFALDLFVWHLCIYRVGAGLATLLANTQVFFVTGISAVLLGERIGWRVLLYALVAIGGIALLTYPRVSSGSLDAIGLGLGVMAACFYAAYLLVLRWGLQTGQTVAPFLNLGLISGVMALELLLGGLMLGESPLEVSAAQLGKLVVLGLVAQVLGWLSIARALPALPASLGALLLLLQPVLATGWGVLFFGEPLGLFEVSGMGLTLAAIYLASVRPQG